MKWLDHDARRWAKSVSKKPLSVSAWPVLGALLAAVASVLAAWLRFDKTFAWVAVVFFFLAWALFERRGFLLLLQKQVEAESDVSVQQYGFGMKMLVVVGAVVFFTLKLIK